MKTLINAAAIVGKCALVMLFMPVALFVLMSIDAECDRRNWLGDNVRTSKRLEEDLFGKPWRWAIRRVV